MISYTLLLLILLSASGYASSGSWDTEIIEDITKRIRSLQVDTRSEWEKSRDMALKEYSMRLEKVHGVSVKAEEEEDLFILDAKLTGLFALPTDNPASDPLCSCRMLGSRLEHPDELFEEAYEKGHMSILKCLLTIPPEKWRNQERARLLLAITYKWDDCYDETLWIQCWSEACTSIDIKSALIAGNEEFLCDFSSHLPPNHDDNPFLYLYAYFEECLPDIAKHDVVGTIRYLLEELQIPLKFFKPYVERFAEASAVEILDKLCTAGLKDVVINAAIAHNVPEVILRLIKDNVEVPNEVFEEAARFNSAKGCSYKAKVWKVANELRTRLAQRMESAPTIMGKETLVLESLNQALLSSGEEDPLLLRQMLEGTILDDFKLSVVFQLSLESGYKGILRSLQGFDLSEWDWEFDCRLFLCKTYKSDWYDETLWMALWFEVDYKDIMKVVYASGNTMLMKDVHNLPRSSKYYIPPHSRQLFLNSIALISEEDAVNAIKFALKRSLVNVDHLVKSLPLFLWNRSVQILQLLKGYDVPISISKGQIAEAVKMKNIKFILFAKEYDLHPTEITDDCFHRAISTNNPQFIEYAFQRGYKLRIVDLMVYWELGEKSLLRPLLKGAEKDVIFEFIEHLVKSHDHEELKRILDEGAWDRMDVDDLDRLAQKASSFVLTLIYDKLKLLPSYKAMMGAFERGDMDVFSFIRDHVVEEAEASPSQVNPELVKGFPMAIMKSDLDTIYKALWHGYLPTEIDLILSLQPANFSHSKILFHFAQVTIPLMEKVLFGRNQFAIDNLLTLDIKVNATTLTELVKAKKLDVIKAIYLKKKMTPSNDDFKLAMDKGSHEVAAFIWLAREKGLSRNVAQKLKTIELLNEHLRSHIDFFVKEDRNLKCLMLLCSANKALAEEVMQRAIEHDRADIIKKISSENSNLAASPEKYLHDHLNDFVKDGMKHPKCLMEFCNMSRVFALAIILKAIDNGSTEIVDMILKEDKHNVCVSAFIYAFKYGKYDLVRRIAHTNMDAVVDHICNPPSPNSRKMLYHLTEKHDIAFTPKQREMINSSGIVPESAKDNLKTCLQLLLSASLKKCSA